MKASTDCDTHWRPTKIKCWSRTVPVVSSTVIVDIKPQLGCAEKRDWEDSLYQPQLTQAHFQKETAHVAHKNWSYQHHEDVPTSFQKILSTRNWLPSLLVKPTVSVDDRSNCWWCVYCLTLFQGWFRKKTSLKVLQNDRNITLISGRILCVQSFHLSEAVLFYFSNSESEWPNSPNRDTLPKQCVIFKNIYVRSHSSSRCQSFGTTSQRDVLNADGLVLSIMFSKNPITERKKFHRRSVADPTGVLPANDGSRLTSSDFCSGADLLTAIINFNKLVLPHTSASSSTAFFRIFGRNVCQLTRHSTPQICSTQCLW